MTETDPVSKTGQKRTGFGACQTAYPVVWGLCACGWDKWQVHENENATIYLPLLHLKAWMNSVFLLLNIYCI